MNKFEYLENYIEFIAGYIDSDGRHRMIASCQISVASYDKNLIESLANQTFNNCLAYSDRQLDIAIKLVKKYSRQLFNNNIEVPDTLPPCKYGTRVVNRTRSLTIEGDSLILKFPYVKELINSIRLIKDEHCGRVIFDHSDRLWKLAITEANILMSVDFGRTHNFSISDDVIYLHNKINAAMQGDYKIILGVDANGCVINNAPKPLIEWLSDIGCEFKTDDILFLADNAGNFGYSIDGEVREIIRSKFSEKMSKIILGDRGLEVGHRNSIAFEDIMEYAKLTNRFPIYVYDNIGALKTKFKKCSDIIFIGRGTKIDGPIKLFVTTSKTPIGSRREQWFTTAEKVLTII